MEANKVWLGVLLVVVGLIMLTPAMQLVGMPGCNLACSSSTHMTVFAGGPSHAGAIGHHVAGSLASVILPLGLVALGLLALRRGRRDSRYSK